MTGESGDGFPDAKWIPAHKDRFTVPTTPRTIEEIVLHITEGGTGKAEITAKNAFGIAKYMQNGHWMAQASHYIVGRDGTIVQCVRHKDIAHHASGANPWTIGIEHNTTSKDAKLTAAQYLKSAELVVWLCHRFGFPPTRNYISGHSEVDPGTSHSRCPGRVLKWDTYMAAIWHVQEVSQGRVPMRLWSDDDV
jgi:N-acetyl-anhydromuramyl-L-alanine amidase AmpD